MIYYVTGALGHGKSMYAARRCGRALLEGRVVATNIRFQEGWERIVLRRSPYYWFARSSTRRVYEREVRARYAYVPDVSELLSARVRGRGENRGLKVLDEAHNELNNREWAEANQKVALRKLTLARKRGWEVLIVSQHKDNTDAAARRIASIEVRCINWRKLSRVPLIGTPLLPFNLFLALSYPANIPAQVKDAQRPMFRELYRVGWYAALYDTFEDFDTGSEADEESLWLPLRGESIPGAGPVLPAARGRAEGGAPAGLADGPTPEGSPVPAPRGASEPSPAWWASSS